MKTSFATLNDLMREAYQTGPDTPVMRRYGEEKDRAAAGVILGDIRRFAMNSNGPEKQPAGPPPSLEGQPAKSRKFICLTNAEAREKRHNPWYCRKCGKLVYISYSYFWDKEDGGDYEVPSCPICGSLAVAEKPERETPEGFEARTGRPWNDDSGVYMQAGKEGKWALMTYSEAKCFAARLDDDDGFFGSIPYQIYCANSDAGTPG